MKYAKYNLSILDPEIEKNFDAREYTATLQVPDTTDQFDHPMGLDPNMRASQDSDFRGSSVKVVNQVIPILDSSLSTSNKAPTRNLLREIESITDQ